MPNNMTDQERIAKADKVFRQMESIMSNLYERWQDESEYEDFKEYEKVAEARLIKIDPDVRFKRMTKRPFALEFSIGKAIYRLNVNAKTYKVIRVR